jgi:hypothetical protein
MKSTTAHGSGGKPSDLGPSSNGERRHGSRVWVDLPVDVYVNGLARRCRVVDVSLSGMVIELTDALAKSKPHSCSIYAIHPGGQRALRVAARTVWQRGAMQASCFVALSDDERATLGEMVNTALRRASDIARLELAERTDRSWPRGGWRTRTAVITPVEGTGSHGVA